MPRFKRRPEQRFTDIIPIWEAARLEGGAVYTASSYNDAVHKVHRLNQYRKELREVDDICPLDEFVVRAVGDEVHILPRPTVDLTKLRSLTGKPYSEIFKEAPQTRVKTPESELQRHMRFFREKYPDGAPWEEPAAKPRSLGLNTESDITEGIEQTKIEPKD
jgi:hypothetical protein